MSSCTPRFEPLEPRLLLSGLNPVGEQPDGGLSDKIVYIHAGHGITANNLTNGSWGYQRPLLLDMVEDLGNQDQMTLFADYLFNAGATVVPLRPIGTQTNEVVLDNDDAGVTFSSGWNVSSSSIYYGSPGDVPYLFAGTSTTETAVATYTPDLPEAGIYPVYAWTRYGSDRVDQLYRINHAGGSTEVRVDHTKVGNGAVYLGSYYFEQGTAGNVEISNQSDQSGVVIADMIRFGNGIGDIDRGGGVSGQPRHNEAALYWIQWHVDRSQGVATSTYRVSSDDGSATVGASPRYAAYMNRASSGSLSDRVFISYHSNAFNGGARGVLSLHNTANGGATPNQFDLALLTAQEINDDLVAQNGNFDLNWEDRGNNLTFQANFNYGEINNSVINNEFDATIIETGFHDNVTDAPMLRDPAVRDALARATYQSVVKYFRSVDGNTTSATELPPPVTNVRAQAAGAGSVTVSWSAPSANSWAGGTATGYRVYASTNGRGFDGGTFVSGGANTSLTLTGLDPDAGTHYFKVVAVNAGGESLGSEVVAATPRAGNNKVLIVNGFDRLDRNQNVQESFNGSSTNFADRVQPALMNAFNYAIQHAEAIENYDPELVIDTASNESVLAGSVSLSNYDAVIWILGEESTANDTFNNAEQTLVANYLGAGGNLFVSGAEIGWDLDALGNGASFYNNTLRADYVADDANTYTASGEAGTDYAGISLSFDTRDSVYDAEFADVITPTNGSSAILRYSTGGVAAVSFGDGTGGGVVTLGFPFETIADEADRNAVMAAALEGFGLDAGFINVNLVLDNDDGPSVYTETGSWSTSLSNGFDGSTYRFDEVGQGSAATWTFNAPLAGAYTVEVFYRAGTNRASNTVYRISSDSGPQTVSINQQNNNLTFVTLGTFNMNAGVNTITLDAGSSTGGPVVIADAVRVSATLAVPPTPGDFDDDGDADADDADLLIAQLGRAVTPANDAFDLNGDDAIDSRDLDAWIRDLVGSNYGDLDVDGDVDLDDANALVANYTGTNGTGKTWANGDTDGDRDVDIVDLTRLTSHYTGDAQALNVLLASGIPPQNPPTPPEDPAPPTRQPFRPSNRQPFQPSLRQSLTATTDTTPIRQTRMAMMASQETRGRRMQMRRPTPAYTPPTVSPATDPAEVVVLDADAMFRRRPMLRRR